MNHITRMDLAGEEHQVLTLLNLANTLKCVDEEAIPHFPNLLFHGQRPAKHSTTGMGILV